MTMECSQGVCGHASQYKRLISIIKRCRKKSEDLSNTLEELHKIHPQLQEILLLYSFILEQFTPFKKWILKHQLNCYEGFFAESVGFWPWLLGWIVVLGAYLFYCCWIFAWSISNGNLLLKPWGLNFAIGAIQDILFIQIAKLTLLYYIAILSIKPQLVEIKHILRQSALLYVQSNSEVADDCSSPTSSRMSSYRLLRNVSSQTTGRFSLVSMDSARSTQSTRFSSRRKGKVVNNLLVSSLSVRKMLRQQFPHPQTQFSLVQHVSYTCRTAWKHPFRDLFMSKLLQQMDDYDAIIMRRQRRHRTGLMSILLIFIPIALPLTGVTFAQLLLDIIFPLISSGLLLSGYYLYSVGLVYLLIPWITIFVFVFWYFGFFKKVYNYAYTRSDEILRVGMANDAVPKIMLQRQSSHSKYPNTRLTNAPVAPPQRKVPNILIYAFRTVRQGLKSVIPTIARSHPWFQAVIAKQKEEQLDQIWKCMNLPRELQGRTIPLTIQDMTATVTQDITHVRNTSTHLQHLQGLLKVYNDRKVLKTKLEEEKRELKSNSFDDGEPIICDDFDFKSSLDQGDDFESFRSNGQWSSFYQVKGSLLTPDALPKPIRAMAARSAYKTPSSFVTKLTSTALKTTSPSISTYIEQWKHPESKRYSEVENFISTLLKASMKHRAPLDHLSHLPNRLAKLYADKRRKLHSIDEVMYYLTTSLIEKQLNEVQLYQSSLMGVYREKYDTNEGVVSEFSSQSEDHSSHPRTFLEKYRRWDSDDERDINAADVTQSLASFHDIVPFDTLPKMLCGEETLEVDTEEKDKFRVNYRFKSDSLRLKVDRRVEDMVTCIMLRGYYWLVRVHDLKIFLTESLWEVYEPHYIVTTPSTPSSQARTSSLPSSVEQRRFLMSKEEKEEFLQSFFQWMTSSKEYQKEMKDFFLMMNVASSHRVRSLGINDQHNGHEEYISLHIFKQWLEKQLQHIIKIKLLH